MPKDPKKLGIFTGRGWLVVLAVAVGLALRRTNDKEHVK